MKKLLLSISVIAAFVLYSFHQQSEISELKVVAPQTSPQPTTPLNTPVSASSPTPPPSQTLTQTYKDGSYTGDVTDAVYGPYQVQVTISGGKITDIKFLQYPNDRDTSIEINTQAMPFLKQEAITAQNAQVDIVSGATDSSIAFRESLQSALNHAL